MSRLASSIESLKEASQGLRQEWVGVKPTWKSIDQERWERKHMRNIEDVMGQQLVSLEMLNQTLDQAHRELP
jgi:hypothetical protein